jgi:hypothetical protein
LRADVNSPYKQNAELTVLAIGCPSKLVLIRNNQNKSFVSVVSLLYYETEGFGVLIEPKQTEEQSKQFDREHILVFVQKILGCFGCFGLLQKSSVCFRCSDIG